jgi:hypothetical protein
VTGGTRIAAVLSGAIIAVGVYALVHTAAAKSPRYCLTIAAGLRPELREEVSTIDLVIENGSVVAIPRFPAGWGLKVQNYSDNTPTTIFGGATGSAAELRSEDLRCLFEIENGVPGTPPIRVSGKIAISTGENERRVVLRKNQIVLEKINSSR